MSADSAASDAAARKPAGLFVKNFKKCENRDNDEFRSASPAA
jgi:hypothetical protein